MKKIILGREKLNLAGIEAVARQKVLVSAAPAALKKMAKSRRIFEEAVKKGKPVYGVTTQFGGDIDLTDKPLELGQKEFLSRLKQRQVNLINSHNCGLGEEIPEDVGRAAMLLRANSLARGFSGVRLEVVLKLVEFLNKGITPVIRRYGSVGASGDLIPLSAVAAALIGLGECRYRGQKHKTSALLKKLKIKPLELEAKEGLALINGTSFLTAAAALAIFDLRQLFPAILSGLGISFEALRGIKGAYHPFIHQAKGHQSQREINKFFNEFWKGSRLTQENDSQDFYSLRAVPQGFGPFWENLKKAEEWIEAEANSANDNPLVEIASAKIFNGANFMGYYATEACDILKIDIAQASSWIHAVLGNLLHPRKNKGLPANLASEPAQNIGLKALQMLAASLAVQNRKLALPQQAVMIPTEGDNQDVNSLGAHAALDLKAAVENLENLAAILLLAATQAVELRGIGGAGVKTKKIHKLIRQKVAFFKKDRPLAEDIEAIVKLVKARRF